MDGYIRMRWLPLMLTLEKNVGVLRNQRSFPASAITLTTQLSQSHNEATLVPLEGSCKPAQVWRVMAIRGLYI